MFRSFLLLLVPVLLASAPASSQPLLEEAKAFNPFSETSMAVTGPVILSTDRMVFETGRFLDLKVLDHEASGKWGISGDLPSAQLFQVIGDAGPLRQGNTLCGDEPVTHMAAWSENVFGYNFLVIAMFIGMAVPSDVRDETMCAIYVYSIGVDD